MPIPFLGYVLQEGVHAVPFLIPILKAVPWILLVAALKLFFSARTNKSERVMHSKVIMVTVRRCCCFSYP